MKAERQLAQQSEAQSLETAVAQAIEACDGDLRATIRALIVANKFLEGQISRGYRRGVKHGRFSNVSMLHEMDSLRNATQLSSRQIGG